MGAKLGRSELPGRSKEKSTNSPFDIWSSSFLGRQGTSSGDAVDSAEACGDDSSQATCDGLPKSSCGAVGQVGSGGELDTAVGV